MYSLILAYAACLRSFSFEQDKLVSRLHNVLITELLLSHLDYYSNIWINTGILVYVHTHCFRQDYKILNSPPRFQLSFIIAVWIRSLSHSPSLSPT